MRHVIRILIFAAFITAVFVSGFSAGLCVEVFITRGVPVVNGGGELVLLLAIPAATVAGYIAGIKKAKRRELPDESIRYTD